ncbi:MAG: DMT family transporter [Roseovarius sp.]
MARSDNLTGVLLMMGSMACFTFNDALMKTLADEIPLYQLLFLRGVLTSAAVAVLAWRMGALWARLSRRDAWLVFWRMVAETGAAYFFLTALFNMPIANVTAIMQALPLTITLAAALFLREPVGWRRLTAILAGFCGVLLIVRPGADDFTIYSLYGLAAVACVTLRDLVTRRLSAETPSIFVTLITSLTIMSVFGLASLAGDWAPMDGPALAVTAGAAVMIIGGYLFSIMTMRVGEISFVTPFRYTSLIWALLLGFVLFGEWPAPLTFLGAAIVVGCGLFTIWREARVARAWRYAQSARVRPRGL